MIKNLSQFSRNKHSSQGVDDRVITEGYTRDELLDALKNGGMLLSQPSTTLRDDYNSVVLSVYDTTNSENSVFIRGMGFYNWLDSHSNGVHVANNSPVPYGDETPVIFVGEDEDSELLQQMGAGNEFEKLAVIGPDILKVPENVEDEFLDTLDSNILKFKNFFLLEVAPASLGLSIALDEVNQELGILLGDKNVSVNFNKISQLFESAILLRAHEWLCTEIGLSDENSARIIATQLAKSLPNPSMESVSELIRQSKRNNDVVSDVGKLLAKNLKGK